MSQLVSMKTCFVRCALRNTDCLLFLLTREYYEILKPLIFFKCVPDLYTVAAEWNYKQEGILANYGKF